MNTLTGWILSLRKQKKDSFISLITPKSHSPIQAVVDNALSAPNLSTGAAVKLTGNLVNFNDKIELKVTEKVKVLSKCDPNTYPMSKNKLPLEYLREYPHLRHRTRLFNSIFRVRNNATMAIHEFFQKQEFIQIHCPIITSSDCEGGSSQFQLTTNNTPGDDDPTKKKSFFGKKTYLTVSSQLHLEPFAALSMNVYSFGPCFRAEASNTTRHLAEFWMVEAEIGFLENLDELMDFVENQITSTISKVLENSKSQLETITLINTFQTQQIPPPSTTIQTKFNRISYKTALQILAKNHNSLLHPPPTWGTDLSTDQERFLVDTHFNKQPVFIHSYPKEIKPFYMRQTDNDVDDTVACFDLLWPGVGELAGGSLREERREVLEGKMQNKGVDSGALGWYLETREFGGVRHGGYGVGVERLMQVLTRVGNVKDLIAYPRVVGNCLQ